MNSIYKIWFKPSRDEPNVFDFDNENGIVSTGFLWEPNFNTEKEALKEIKLAIRESDSILNIGDYQIIRFDLN